MADIGIAGHFNIHPNKNHRRASAGAQGEHAALWLALLIAVAHR